jgi:cytochrome c553
MKIRHGLTMLALMASAGLAQAQDANCHGTDGRAQPGMESLAGANKDDMVKKMLDFKAGRKPATIMHQLAKGYSDEQITAIAGYFAAQKK